MRLGFAKQYQKSCIILEEGDLPEDVIERAEREDAIFWEGPDELAFVVQFPNRPKELYSRDALMRSFPV